MTTQPEVRKHRRPGRKGWKPPNPRCAGCGLFQVRGDLCGLCGLCGPCCPGDHREDLDEDLDEEW